METPQIALVIFTCQGKEHLLPTCYASFKENCNITFSKVILATDGQIDIGAINTIQPDILVQNQVRKGYIFNILNALALIDTEYFFWLEDDFNFEQPIPIDRMVDVLKSQEYWSGIFLSRSAPLTENDKQVHLFDEFYIPEFGYSVSPTLCRTKHIRAAFRAMLNYPKTEDTKVYGFETFMKDYFEGNGISYALMDPGKNPHVNHIGRLESTAREYHMINSLDQQTSLIGKEHLSGFGNRKIKLTSKIALLVKLTLSTFQLGVLQFRNKKSYDFAMRFYINFKNKSYLK